MKTKIITLLITLISLVACIPDGSNTADASTLTETSAPITVRQIGVRSTSRTGIAIYDVSYNGHNHEFISTVSIYAGLEHWPSCRYCLEEKNETQPDN